MAFVRVWGLALWVWLLGTLVFFPPRVAEAFAVPAEVWLVSGAGVVAWVAIAYRAWRGAPLWPALPGVGVTASALALLMWVAASVVFALKPAMSAAYAVGVLMFGALGWQLVAMLGAEPRVRDRMYALLGVVVAYETVLGFMQYFRAPLNAWGRSLGVESIFGHLLYWYGGGAKGVPIGTLGNVNYLAEFLCLTVPVLFGWGLSRATQRARLLTCVPLVAPLALLVATGCRGALLGLVLGSAAAWALTRGLGQLHPRYWFVGSKRWLYGCAIVLGLGVLVGLMGDRLSHKWTLDDTSIEARLVNWRAAAAMIPTHPVLGTGLGGYQLGNVAKLAELYPNGLPDVTSGARFYQAHNEALQLAVELGIPGLLLVLGFGFLALRALRARVQQPLAERTGLMAGVLALAIASGFGFPLHVPLTAAVLVVVLSLMLAEPAIEVVPEAGWPRGLGLVYAGVLAVLLVAVGMRTVVPLYQSACYQHLAESLGEAERKPKGLDRIFGLAARLNRFGAPLIFDQLQSLTRQKRYDEVVTIYEQHQGDGLGMDATLLYGNALHQLGRLDEADRAYQKGLHYYHPEHPNYAQARARAQELRKDAVAGERAKPAR